MININEVINYVKNYDGPTVRLMEVCGTHTGSIFKNGIRSLISDKIKLISGPGCPVCVTPKAYIDRAAEIALTKDHVLMTFGDMIKVPGTKGSLAIAKAEGANVEIMYSPLEACEKAKKNPHITYVVAAVGFETTAATYALLLEQLTKQNIQNVKIITALKLIAPALDWICATEQDIDGFICPGHVSVITGGEYYEELAQKYQRPFVVTGFEGEHILASIYDILRQIENKKGVVHNLYTNAVHVGGNKKAYDLIKTYFEEGTAIWRGLGPIPDSGLFLKKEYQAYDAGSFDLDDDRNEAPGCMCSAVIIGKVNPNDCHMFGTACTPMSAVGPCMVSGEGACGIWYKNMAAGRK